MRLPVRLYGGIFATPRPASRYYEEASSGTAPAYNGPHDNLATCQVLPAKEAWDSRRCFEHATSAR